MTFKPDRATLGIRVGDQIFFGHLDDDPDFHCLSMGTVLEVIPDEDGEHPDFVVYQPMETDDPDYEPVKRVDCLWLVRMKRFTVVRDGVNFPCTLEVPGVNAPHVFVGP